MAAEVTYDYLVRQCARVIVQCEIELARLRAQLLALQFQQAFAEFMSDEAREQLEALIQSVKDEIEEVERIRDAARAFLAQLRRDHGPLRRARGSAPEGGAERVYYLEGGGGSAAG